jgi:hypothetical protein
MIAQHFYKDTLTDDEVKQLQVTFSDPLVKKYLRIIGQNDLAELATLSLQSMDDSTVSKKVALIQGKLSTLVTLLNISNPE